MASVKKYVKKAPTIIQRAYYGLVPFENRYGEEFKKTYRFLMESLDKDPRTVREYQFRELQKTLATAYDKVPYYHKLMVDNNVPRIITSPDDIKKLPILTKDLIRDNWEDLINKDHIKDYIRFKTSGSTGKRFEFLGNDNLYKREAAFVLRAFNMHGASLYNERTVWVRRYAPSEGDPLYYTDYELNRTYLSPFNISYDTIEEYVNIINKTKAKTLVTYPSLANFMSVLMREKDLYFDYVESIHCASETVLPEWRDNIRRNIGVELYAHYGMMEKVSFFCNTETTGKRYVENLEYGYTEIVDGEVIGTGFLNDVMPLIRYAPGDRAIESLYKDEYHKSLPVTVDDFIGRSTDMITTQDGRKLSGVNFYTMMYKIPGVEMFQIIQHDFKNIEIKFVKSDKFTKLTESEIVEGMMDRVGKAKIKLTEVETLDRSPSGKFKTIISEL